MILPLITQRTLYLASKSPRRRELLGNFGIPFELFDNDTEEDISFSGDPADFVVRLAEKKAEKPLHALKNGVFITADTTVYVDGDILEKPNDRDDAYRMIDILQGNTHTVYTGLAAGILPERIVRTACEATDVTFSPMTPAEIEWYVSSGEYADKAGGYAIQGKASLFVSGISGCYFNVVGLPIRALYTLLNRLEQDITKRDSGG